MHNDVKQCSFAARTCIVAVAVTANESNMASYFPEAGNLNSSNADICSDVAGPSSSGSGDLFELSDRSNNTLDPVLLLFLPTTSTTGRHLGFKRDHNCPTVFRGVLRHYA